MSTHYQGMAWILNHGYELFVFSYRGYLQNPGNPTPRGTVLDGRAALQRVQALARTKKIPWFAVGQSLGGAILLRSLIEEKREGVWAQAPSAVVIEASFHSYQKVARSVLKKSWITWPLQPLAYIVVSDKHAPSNDSQELSPIPLLVIHGTKDPIVPIELGERVYDLAKEPKDFWRIPEGTHVDAFWIHKGRYQSQLIDYFNQHSR
jgi:fermentation-respiration switch protein FrsA (DUF1100 family)